MPAPAFVTILRPPKGGVSTPAPLAVPIPALVAILRRPKESSPTVYVDFGAAIVGVLTTNAAVVSGFGHTTQTPKIWGTLGFQPNMPYLRILEIPADDTFQSEGSDGLVHYIERGQVQIDIFAKSEQLARSLGKLAATALNDASLLFEDGTNLEFRQQRAFFVPEPDAGPGVGAVYHRVILFAYANDCTL